MPKATRANDSATPKKRSRRAKTNGNGARAAQPVTTAPEFAQESRLSPAVEEKIRLRAYELYLQRGGRGGSPEQDWLQAQREIVGGPSIA